MKKTILTLIALAFITTNSFAQDDKKQEPKKKEEKKTEETKQEPAPGGTRMAINEKGLPSKKKTNSTSSTSKSTSTTSETKADGTKSEEPKKHD